MYQNKILLLIVLISFGILFTSFLIQLLGNIPIGNNPVSDIAFALILSATGLFFFFLFRIKLITRISRSGIKYRLYPFHSSFREIEWSAIARAEVIKYKPIRDYGGWGYRNSFGKKGTAFSISGDYGIAIDLKSGKRVLLGTINPIDARAVLDHFDRGEDD